MSRNAIIAAFALLGAVASPAVAQDAPARSITKLAGDVYRFQDNMHFGVFVVTSDGIIVCDPLNVDAATWLEGELARRFDVPVKYVLYSHHHFDHASGASVFADTATIVAHAATTASIQPPAEGAPLSAQARSIDANRDGMLQKQELPPALAAGFETMDANKDGALNGREVFVGAYRNVVAPTQTFEGEKTITLGGKQVKMVHVPGAHASDMSFIYFPAEKVLYVVDVLSTRRLPNSLAGYDEAEQARYFDAALGMPFEVLTPGHGSVGKRDDLVAYRAYYADLKAGVSAGIAGGKSLEEIQKTLLLEKYADWEGYASARTQNIAGMFTHLKGGPAVGAPTR